MKLKEGYEPLPLPWLNPTEDNKKRTLQIE